MMDISRFLNISYGGQIQPPRFVDTEENFNFLLDLVFSHEPISTTDLEEIRKTFLKSMNGSKVNTLLYKISIAVVGGKLVSEEDWESIEEMLTQTLYDKSSFVYYFMLATKYINGNHIRFVQRVPPYDMLPLDRNTIEAVWSSFSMLYHYVFMVYAYQTYIQNK